MSELDPYELPQTWEKNQAKRAARRRRLVAMALLVLAAILVGLWSMSDGTTRAGSTVEGALAHEAEGRLRAAVIELKNALQAEPANADARFHLGRLHLATGDADAALKELERARELGYTAPQLLALVVEGHVEAGDHEGALAILARAAALRAASAAGGKITDTFSLLADAGTVHVLTVTVEQVDGRLQVRGNIDDSPLVGTPSADHMPWPRFALRSDEVSSGPRLGDDRVPGEHGTLLVEDGEASYVLEAVSDDEADSRLVVLRGRAQAGLGRLDAAQASFREALDRDPDNGRAHLGLAVTALRGRRLDEAEREVDRALTLAPEVHNAWWVKGELAAGRGEHAAAQGHFEVALERSPTNAAARLGLVRSMLAQGLTDEAAKQLQILARRAANQPSVQYLQAVVARRRGDAPAARRALLGTLRVDPSYGPALLSMSALHRESGELEQSVELLERFLIRRPGDLRVRLLLARDQLDLGAVNEAIRNAEQVLRAAPGNPAVLMLLGKAQVAREDYAAASQYFARAANAAPDDPMVRSRLALSRLLEGAEEAELSDVAAVLEDAQAHVSASVLLFKTRLRPGDLHGAKEIANSLDERQPNSPLGPTLLGILAEARGDHDAARTHHQEALDRDPDYASAKLNLARLELHDANVAGARARYQSVMAQKGASEKLRDAARLALARLDLEAGELGAARKGYAAVLDDDEANATALMGLAQVVAAEGDHDESVKLLERLRHVHPRARRARQVLASYYRRAGNWKAALPVVQELDALRPDDPAVVRLLARVQRAIGSAETLRTLGRLVRLAPGDAVAHFDLGAARATRGNVAGARAALTRALEIDADHLPAKLGLGALELNAGNFDAALAVAHRIRAAHPDSVADVVLRGDVLAARGHPQYAAKLYENALARAPTGEVFKRLTRAQQAAGDGEDATETLRRWLEASRNSLRDLELLGQAALAEPRRPQIAASAYERMIELQPSHVVALNNLAWLHHERGEDAQGLDLARRAYDTDATRPELADTYGWLLVQTGAVEQGLQVLERALSEAPQIVELRLHVGVGLFLAGDHDRARQMLESVLEGEPDARVRAEAQRLLGLF